MWTVFVEGQYKKTFTNFDRAWMYANACKLRFGRKTVTIVEV